MWHNGRRLLVAGGTAEAWQAAKRRFASVSAEVAALRRELVEIKTQRDEARAALAELADAVRARQDAEAKVRALYREREIARARATERDPGLPLN